MNEAIVADGITRDPIGIIDLYSCLPQDFLNKYPRPSGAELAAKEICSTFCKTKGTLKERIIKCNTNVKKLNSTYIKKCDYLQNDYYGAVASSVYIENNILNYAYICDCGVIVHDNLGNIKFQTEDDKEIYSDPYIDKIESPWNLPEKRVIVRRDYRNNLNNIKDGKCVSYGAITGDDSAVEFIKHGEIELSKGDTILVYSDGFTSFLQDKEFIFQLLDFKKDTFENYINLKSLDDYNKYGKEKTVVIFKN